MLADVVFILQGFGLVMGVLAALWFVSALMGRILAKPPAPPPTAAPMPSVSPPATVGVPAGHLAAITAAVAAATGDRARIVTVRIPPHGAAGWVGSAHTHHAVGRRIAATWRNPTPAHPSSATGREEDRR